MAAPKHQLAAIMFTDIVGYTALMGADEEEAIQLLKSSHQLQKSLIQKYDGNWIKEIGDGVLAKFQSTIDAVNCAIEIQKNSKSKLIRIGIHLGDVFYDNDDIYGDGVNIASRIESTASPGGICISDSVYQNIRNQKGIQAISLGKRSLKNVSVPIELYQLKGEGINIESNITTGMVSWNTTVLLIIAVSIITGVSIWFLKPEYHQVEKAPNYYHIKLPDETRIALIGSTFFGIGQTAFALAPDGSKLVFVGINEDTTQLYIRNLNDLMLSPLNETLGAYRPFFSPDGKWVGYFSANTLKKVSLESNSVFTICEVSYPYGATWLANNEIIFMDNQGAVLKKIPSTGGIPAIITKVNQNNELDGWLSNPSLLPDGRHILCNSGNDGTIIVIELATGSANIITGIKGYSPAYIPTGHITCVKENILIASPFDLKSKNRSGKLYPVINSIRTEIQRPSGQYSIAYDGKIAYVPGSSTELSKFTWVSRSGEELETLPLPTDKYRTFRLSHDGTKVAFPLVPSIWVYDMVNDNKVRVVNSIKRNSFSWGPNQTLVFPLDTNGIFSLFRKSSDGVGEISELVNSSGISGSLSWSKNGESIGYIQNADLYVYSIEQGKNEPLVQTQYNETQIDLSPDGKFFTYLSDETGQLEVYVQSIPPSGKRWNISHGLGIDPIWSIKGDEILYRNTYQWYSVRVNTENGFTSKNPELLFEGSYLDVGGKSFALSPDGQRILLLKSDNDERVSDNLVIVDNWFEEVKRITSDK
ncbi:MAG: hypothetical protein OEQ53_04850 [Saprospiraceae bacterium]|nr:hypothetical protein [Saprospiraceae bacterium]